jgi:hypothetical protein
LAILDPEHLFQQADGLIAPSGGVGAVRQVNLRRAISAAYYGLFHALLTAAADLVVGTTRRTTSQYGLVYRSVDHRAIRELCEEIARPTLKPKYAAHAPPGGGAADLQAFATALIELQQKRLEADYNPLIHIARSDAKIAVRSARAALKRWESISAEQRNAFLALLLFKARP